MFYIKPICKSFSETEFADVVGVLQTGYPVQFSIQAIEFQVSQNTTNNNQTIYTAKADLNSSRIG